MGTTNPAEARRYLDALCATTGDQREMQKTGRERRTVGALGSNQPDHRGARQQSNSEKVRARPDGACSRWGRGGVPMVGAMAWKCGGRDPPNVTSRELSLLSDREATINLGTHLLTFGGWMIEPASQRRGKEVPGVLQLGDLLVQNVEALSSNGLPLGDRGRSQDPVDLVQGQAGVLQQADEDEPAERLGAIAALSRLSPVGGKEAASLVVTDRGGGDARSQGDFADGQKISHVPT